jgi:hypothetical protein
VSQGLLTEMVHRITVIRTPLRQPHIERREKGDAYCH